MSGIRDLYQGKRPAACWNEKGPMFPMWLSSSRVEALNLPGMRGAFATATGNSRHVSRHCAIVTAPQSGARCSMSRSRPTATEAPVEEQPAALRIQVRSGTTRFRPHAMATHRPQAASGLARCIGPRRRRAETFAAHSTRTSAARGCPEVIWASKRRSSRAGLYSPGAVQRQ